MKRIKSYAAVLALLAVLLFCAAGCSNSGAKESFTSPEQLNGKKIGFLSGAVYDDIAQKKLTDIKAQYYNSQIDIAIALSQGKLDAFVADEPLVRFMMREYTDITYLEERLEEDNYAFIFQKNEGGERYCDLMNEFLGKITADGTLKQLDEKWFGTDETKKTMLDYKDLPAVNGTIHMAVSSTAGEPFVYVRDGETVGYDTEITALFCREYGYALEIFDMNFNAVLPGVVSGKYDMGASCISITEEQTQSVLFSEPNYIGGVVIAVKKQTDDAYTSPSELSGKTIGAVSGTTYDSLIRDAGVISAVGEYKYFNSNTDCIAALKSGWVEAVAIDEPAARLAVENNRGVKIIPERVAEDSYGFAFPLGSALTAEFNDALSRLRADGVCEELEGKWLDAESTEKQLISQDWAGTRGVVRYWVSADTEPICYIGEGGDILGYEPDLFLHLARLLDYRVEMVNVDYDGLIQSLISGKADAASGCISITDERKRTVDMSASCYDGGVVLLVRDGTESEETEGFFASVADSFHKTFIKENRWAMILRGLLVTMIISLCSAALGTVLGFGICMLRIIKNKAANAFAAVYIRILQGMPIVVLLMILFYIVFAKTSINSLWIAVAGFSLNFGAYVSEMMRTGIQSVDRGQAEAALAMGFTKTQAFFRIVLPQAAKHFVPVYKGEFISLVKTTSIAGYIAIQDLTQVSDIIRSRTYEAFFPLIATALIYFAISWLLSLLIDLVQRKIIPDRRKRTVRGVACR